MKAEIKEKWIAALESGEYEQGREYLHKGNKFCCLGVLCDLAVKDGVEVKITEEPGDAALHFAYDEMSGILPIKVMRWSGLLCSTGGYEAEDGSTETLTRQNDLGKTFKELAEIIREKL